MIACSIPKAKLLIQPSRQQVVYVESPQPMPQIVEKVVERLAPMAVPMAMQVVDDRLISEQRLPNDFALGQVPLPRSTSPRAAHLPHPPDFLLHIHAVRDSCPASPPAHCRPHPVPPAAAGRH
jgi:hypothetical protein